MALCCILPNRIACTVCSVMRIQAFLIQVLCNVKYFRTDFLFKNIFTPLPHPRVLSLQPLTLYTRSRPFPAKKRTRNASFSLAVVCSEPPSPPPWRVLVVGWLIILAPRLCPHDGSGNYFPHDGGLLRGASREASRGRRRVLAPRARLHLLCARLALIWDCGLETFCVREWVQFPFANSY